MLSNNRVIVTTERNPELIRYTFNLNRNRVISVDYQEGDVENQLWSRDTGAPDALRQIFSEVELFIRNQERRDALEEVVKATKPVRKRH